jgi:hypothetical protein
MTVIFEIPSARITSNGVLGLFTLETRSNRQNAKWIRKLTHQQPEWAFAQAVAWGYSEQDADLAFVVSAQERAASADRRAKRAVDAEAFADSYASRQAVLNAELSAWRRARGFAPDVSDQYAADLRRFLALSGLAARPGTAGEAAAARAGMARISSRYPGDAAFVSA